MRVHVESKVRQVVDGLKYDGFLKIGERTLDYEATFSITLSKIDLGPALKSAEAKKKLLELVIKRDGSALALSEDEYSLFFALIIRKVAEMYYEPQIRAANETLAHSLRNVMPGIDTNLSLSANVTYDMPPSLCGILNDPKFDCQIAA